MSSRPKKRKTGTYFQCKAENASTVFVAGSFNNWNESATPMKRGKNGVWSVTVEVPPGPYEYKFVIDGEWCCSPELLPDSSGASCIPNTFGTMNFMASAAESET